MKVLFVCTLNVARSRMAEVTFRAMARRSDFQTRSAGTASGAIRRLVTRDVVWADVVAVMEEAHLVTIRQRWPRHAEKVRVLGVPDNYGPGDPALQELLEERIKRVLQDLL